MKFQFSFIFMFLFFLSFVVAAPPVTTVQNFPEGYVIETPSFDYIKANEDFKLHVHVYNSSSGFVLDNTSINCYLHMYNSSGSHLIQAQMNFEGPYDWEYYIDKGNFSIFQEYSFIIFCYNTDQGGYLERPFLVNKYGFEEDLIYIFANGFVLLILIGLIASISVKYRGVNFEKWDESIKQSNDHIGKKWVKGFTYGLMKNVFVWYYFIGWIMIFVIENLVLLTHDLELLGYYQLIMNLYSFGFILVMIYLIGYFIKYVQDTVEYATSDAWGMAGK